MEKLPSELLFKILLYLPPMDRLSCSLTCRRWAEAITSSQLLNDVWLDISGHEIETATSVVVNSHRQYTNLVLFEADLSEFDAEFWERIGPNLRELTLENCSWSSHVFYAILQQCTKLEFFKIVNDEDKKVSIEDFAPPEGACHAELRDSLSNVWHLHLKINLMAEILELLLGLMPNVTSVFLSARFDKESDFLERLPSTLKKNRICHTGANLFRTTIRSEALMKFLEMTSGSLKNLRINATHLTESACDAIVNCTSLTFLSLHCFPESFHSSHLEKLVSNFPDLSILDLNGMNLEVHFFELMMQLFKLKKLRTLSLSCFCPTVFTNESLCRLGEISTLVDLYLRNIHINSLVMRSLGRLTNLRHLELLEVDIDSECFGAICENFERLAELSVESLKNLTDADGSKLCRFKELRSLNFSGGHGFTDLTFKRGVGPRTMKSLSINGCSLTDDGLTSIASHHDRLEKLALHDCTNITGAGILALLKNEPRLKIFIGNCVAKVERELTAVRNVCPRLRLLRPSLI